MKKLFLTVAIFISMLVIVMNSGCSNKPAGKSWMSQDAWTEFDLGNSSLGGNDFLNYNKQLFDGIGNPIRHIHRTGTFKVEGSFVHCSFNDGQPPYLLEYKKVDGDWCVVDENGNMFIWDDPAKRK